MVVEKVISIGKMEFPKCSAVQFSLLYVERIYINLIFGYVHTFSEITCKAVVI